MSFISFSKEQFFYTLIYRILLICRFTHQFRNNNVLMYQFVYTTLEHIFQMMMSSWINRDTVGLLLFVKMRLRCILLRLENLLKHWKGFQPKWISFIGLLKRNISTITCWKRSLEIDLKIKINLMNCSKVKI